MTDVVVIGAGLGGLATAARLAKLGHRVIVCERSERPGGLLERISHDGSSWDATPMQTTIPAVLRDLFRKSGRPLERYVDLEPSTPARRHLFSDGTTLDLPTGSRGAQLDAVSRALGSSAGVAWTGFVDRHGDVWELLRTAVLDNPAGPVRLSERKVANALRTRRSLERELAEALTDDRLRLLAGYPAQREGGDPRTEPAFRSVDSYVERTFGVWRFPGGTADLTDALLERMDERGVEVRFRTEVTSVRTAAGRATGVTLADGSLLGSDVVVAAVSPQQVFGRLLDHPVARRAAALTAAPPGPRGTVSYLALAPEAPMLPREVVLHGEPLVVVSTEVGPGVCPAWTVTSHGFGADDVLLTMARRGLDVRDLVRSRLERPAGGPLPGWAGRRTAVARAALGRPLPGLHCLGTGLVLGASVPYVAWQAAHVAEAIGRA